MKQIEITADAIRVISNNKVISTYTCTMMVTSKKTKDEVVERLKQLHVGAGPYEIIEPVYPLSISRKYMAKCDII